MNIQIEPSWKEALAAEFEKEYFVNLTNEVRASYLIGDPPVYPPAPLVFNAFNQTPLDQVRVVILGQDPYHGPGQAMGLSFSVPEGVTIPPSLRNIYKEIERDTSEPATKRTSGDLTHWTEQGVLLLNATLTVEKGRSGSHQKLDWETFTDAVIKIISDQKQHVVFLLWGKFAISKSALINTKAHLVLTSPHPSPFSADRGFFGCKHFSKTNEYLKQHGQPPIQW
jgi:uracil-DNA glycosylase